MCMKCDIALIHEDLNAALINSVQKTRQKSGQADNIHRQGARAEP